MLTLLIIALIAISLTGAALAFVVLGIQLVVWDVLLYVAKKIFYMRLANCDFKVHEKYPESGFGMLFLDRAAKRWIVRCDRFSPPEIFKFSDLMWFEVHRDEKVIARGQFGNLMAGQDFFDEAPGTCRQLELKIKVNDYKNQERVLVFVRHKTMNKKIPLPDCASSMKRLRPAVSKLLQIQRDAQGLFPAFVNQEGIR